MQRVPEIALVTVLLLGCAGALSGQVGLGGLPYPLRTDLPRPLGLNPPAASYTGILPGALQADAGSGRACRRVPPVFVAPPYYVPYYGPWPSFSDSYAAPRAVPVEDPKAAARAAAQQALAEQLQQLRSALDEFQRDRVTSPPPPVASPPPVPSRPEPPPVPLTVVLRSGQRFTVQSYAVMDGVLWDFSRRPVRRVPLAEMDLAGSRRATEAQGGEFPRLGL